MERTVSLLGRLGAATLKAAVERVFLRLLAPFDVRHLKMMIDNSFYLIETIEWAVSHPPDYEPVEGVLTPEEIQQLKAREQVLLKMAITTLGMARTAAKGFPRHMVQQYCSAGYALKYFGEKRPDLVPTFLHYQGGRSWLKKQTKEIDDWLYSR